MTNTFMTPTTCLKRNSIKSLLGLCQELCSSPLTSYSTSLCLIFIESLCRSHSCSRNNLIKSTSIQKFNIIFFSSGSFSFLSTPTLATLSQSKVWAFRLFFLSYSASGSITKVFFSLSTLLCLSLPICSVEFLYSSGTQSFCKFQVLHPHLQTQATNFPNRNPLTARAHPPPQGVSRLPGCYQAFLRYCFH